MNDNFFPAEPESETYFKIEYFSNSSLSAFKALLNGAEPFKAKEETLEFGKLFHLAAFEPEKYKAKGFTEHTPKIDQMVKSLHANLSFQVLVRNPEVKFEHEKYFRCKYTGVMCKLKTDAITPGNIGDAKSTTCKEYEGFIQTIIQYDYNRQAAFYMDGTGRDQFTFWGVQKSYPYKTFTKMYRKNDPEIQAGREEYIYLIEKAKSMGLVIPH